MLKHSRGLGAAREVVLRPSFFLFNFLIYNVMKKIYEDDLWEISALIRKLGIEVYGEDVFKSNPVALNEFVRGVTYIIFHYDKYFKSPD